MTRTGAARPGAGRPGGRSIPGTAAGLRFIRGSGRARPAATLAAAALAVAWLACGCDWLSPATPESPKPKNVARTVALTAPESALVNIKEAFRVGSVQVYMRSIYQAPVVGDDFLAVFDPDDAAQLGTDDASRQLLNGGWHSNQEQAALSSVMNALSAADPDTGRASIVVTTNEGGQSEGWVLDVAYRVNIAVGTAPFAAGTARLVLRTNTANEYQIVKWTDFRNAGTTAASWGSMRFKNHS